MNVPFYTTINILLCMSSLFSLIPNSSGLLKGKGQCPSEKHKLPRRTMTINISDSRGKRHNLPLVGVDNVDLHRIATCTKAPGRLVCKSGRYNYVINNGNFEFPAETLEKFVSALYQKAKDKESDFAVSLVAPEKESAPLVSQCQPTLPTFTKEVTEAEDQLQPVTIECELTDAKTLKETNPDYQPKPNEKVFKCNTKRVGMKRKRNPLHVLMKQDQAANIIGSSEHSLRNTVEERRRKRSPVPQHLWKIYEPFWEKSKEHSLQTRSLSSYSAKSLKGRYRYISYTHKNCAEEGEQNELFVKQWLYAEKARFMLDKHNIDFVRKTGFGSMFHKPEVEDEGNENEKDVAGYFHHEYPRPRVRDYNHTCGDSQPLGWCPPLRSTTCIAHTCAFTSTLHPTFYTENPDEEGPDEDRRLRKRMSYKFRNPLMEFFIPYGLRSFTKGETHCTGCSCTDSTTQHVCKDDADTTESEPIESGKILKASDEEVTTPCEDEYYDSSEVTEEPKCKCSNHRKHDCEKGHKQFGHKQGCGYLEEYNSDCKTEKSHVKEFKKHDPLGGGGGGGCKCCKCDIICCCDCPPKNKGPKSTTKPSSTKHTTARRTTPKRTTRSTRCTVITQKICIGLRGENRPSEPTMDVLQSISESKNQLELPPYSK